MGQRARGQGLLPATGNYQICFCRPVRLFSPSERVRCGKASAGITRFFNRRMPAERLLLNFFHL